MSMEINNVYNNYTGSYSKTNEEKEAVKSLEKQGSVEKAEQTESTRKTAVDELAYLIQKYDGYSFVGVNFKPGMRYGTLATTNIAISPEFLKKMANDPALEKEYTDQFEGMKKLDEQNIKSHEAGGRHLIAQGWVIDKNGGMSKWSISKADNKRHYGQEMINYANKLRKKKLEKKKEQEKIAAKKEYLISLQKQVPYMKLQMGSAVNTKNDGKVNVLDINPKLLEKMQNDPEAAKKYSQRIKDVEIAHKFVDSYLKSTGSTVVCSHAYLDENGNYCNFTVSVHKDTLNEKLRKEADENTKKRIEKTRENLKKKSEELEQKNEEKESDVSVEKMIEEKVDNSVDGSIYFNSDEMKKIVQKAKQENGEKDTGAYVDLKI